MGSADVGAPEPIPGPEPMRVTFDVQNWDEHRLVDYIAQQVQAQASDRIDRDVRERVEQLLDVKLTEILDHKLTAMVEQVLAEGWHEQNDWGGRGKEVTFRDRVAAILKSRTSDYNRKTLVDKIVADEADKLLRGECRKVIDEALGKFKAQIDETLAAGFRDGLRKQLGLG